MDNCETDETEYDILFGDAELEDDELVEVIDDAELGEEDNYFESDFVRNSAEMNLGRPEDLDEAGESSMSSSRVSQMIFIIILY